MVMVMVMKKTRTEMEKQRDAQAHWYYGEVCIGWESRRCQFLRSGPQPASEISAEPGQQSTKRQYLPPSPA